MHNVEQKTPFTLVVDNAVRDRTLAKFAQLSDSIWAHKPRKQAVLERNFLMLNSVRVDGAPRITHEVLQSVWKSLRTGERSEETVEAIRLADLRANEMRRIMSEYLRDAHCDSVFHTSRITPVIRASLKDSLERFMLHFGVLSGEIGMLSEEGQSHAISKLREVHDEIADAVRSIA